MFPVQVVSITLDVISHTFSHNIVCILQWNDYGLTSTLLRLLTSSKVTSWNFSVIALSGSEIFIFHDLNNGSMGNTALYHLFCMFCVGFRWQWFSLLCIYCNILQCNIVIDFTC